MRKLTVEELARKSVNEYRMATKNAIVLVLDNIRSMNNTGSIFRTADAFLLEKIILCGITATPPHREIQKTALGATESVTWSYSPTTEEAIVELKKAGYKIVAVEQAENSLKLDSDFDIEFPIALIFGNEVDGVSQNIVNISDYCLEIPQYGTKHSLNVTVCAGIVIWEMLQRQTKPITDCK
jgi:tRNA G18 (ribose-2'-O)-methylase SpoU